ncbi:MAG: hypothetical protein K2Y26_08465 [Gemmatimonadaceae bacterium]|nr:hypothetical protein [Gemmatimonadaceae bacterium]
MKRFFGALAGAAMMMAPVAAQAQLPIDPEVIVTVKNNPPYGTGGTGYEGGGGGYLANFTVNFPAPTGDRTFTDYLIWCIDGGRGIGFNEPTTFELYKFSDFALNLDLKSVNGHHPDLGDLNKIASLQAALLAGWDDPNVNRENYQGSIWSEFDGYSTYGGNNALGNIIAGDPFFDTSEYYVLWNGQSQTFLTRISEPSSALLAFAGMGAFLVAGRRRRIS